MVLQEQLQNQQVVTSKLCDTLTLMMFIFVIGAKSLIINLMIMNLGNDVEVPLGTEQAH